MKPRMLAMIGALVLAVGAAGGMAWWPRGETPEPVSPDADPAATIPVPPFPPRLAEDDRYDKCMTMIAEDPEGAEAIASSWQVSGGGDAAIHCQALAAIATGEPERGARMLEELARGGTVEGMMRAVLLGQAAAARLIAEQAETALQDTTEALSVAPDDPDLLIGRANAFDALERNNDAVEDLDRALRRDPARGDALVLRASIWRRMDRLDEARSDIDKAIVLDPDDAEALLERGILRQLKGDLAGARQDWTRVRDLDPNTEAAELAAQNLTLLDSGPASK
jgi:tetratricopeptide (TPR) repeat protein